MLEANEFCGKTIDDAIAKGLAAWNVSREEVDVEVVREGSRGVLGLGGAEARVRLTRRAASVTTPDARTDAQDILEGLLSRMGIRARVEIQPATEAEGPDAFVLNIVGDDLGMLIGRRGETLRDLEYLARLIVASKTRSNARFMVDVEGYRTRRERVLRELAKRMADRVRQNRQPITLEAMPPNERRIVHITLREHPNVKTQSIGEGDRRRVMILPK